MYTANELYMGYCLIFRQRKFVTAFLLCCLFWMPEIFGQARVPCNQITADMGFTVRSVHITGRWVSKKLQSEVERATVPGQPFNPATVAAAQQLIADELAKGEEQFTFQVIKGSTSVLYISTDICDVSDTTGPRQVEITIHPYYLQVDLFNTGNNILPVPRSARPSFYDHVPKAIMATSPLFGFTNDRRYGPALFMQTNTDLLHIPGIVKPDKGAKSIRLDLGLNVRKSLSDAFHTIGAGLDFIHPVYADTSIGWNLGAHYDQSLQPLGQGEYKRKLMQVHAAVQGSLKIVLFSKYVFGGAVSFLQNRYSSLPGNQLENTENDYGLFALGDGRMGKGFSRLGLWFDAGVPAGNSDVTNYERLAARFAYAISLGSGHNNVDVETMLGSGYSWGSPPPYGQFFAGNSSWNFLYEPLNSNRNHSMPEGPVVRSLGESQGALNAATGGNLYWHFNLNIAIPVTRWSRPLIPDIVVSEQPRSTLATKLKGQVETAKNWIIEDMIKNGAPDNDSTEAAAEKIVGKDIRPTIKYLADRANVFSFKPILLFDAAQVSDRILANKTWIAAGSGIQLNIVNARLETGYMHTLFPAADASKGNFFVRFTLQNFY